MKIWIKSWRISNMSYLLSVKIQNPFFFLEKTLFLISIFLFNSRIWYPHTINIIPNCIKNNSPTASSSNLRNIVLRHVRNIGNKIFVNFRFDTRAMFARARAMLWTLFKLHWCMDPRLLYFYLERSQFSRSCSVILWEKHAPIRQGSKGTRVPARVQFNRIPWPRSKFLWNTTLYCS